MKGNQKSLLASGVALLASVGLLAGTTFAWFTDSVVNTGNKIQAGNLAIGAYAYDLAEDGEGGFEIEGVNGGKAFAFETEGQNLKEDDAPIISKELFEPGKSNAKLLKVENEGTLAAKIGLDFTVEDGGLMEALWFDFVKVENGEVKGNFTRRPMNTLETFAENLELPLLEKGDNVQFILIYGMDENAGNAFKDKFFTVDVAILATQYTKEEDGFGNDQYDKDAPLDFVPVSTADGLMKAIENAEADEVIQLQEDIELQGTIPQSASGVTSIDLNDHTLDLTANQTTYVSGGDEMIIRNGKLDIDGFDEAATSAISVETGSSLTLENVDYTCNATALYPRGDAAQVNVINSTINAKGYCLGTNAGSPDNYKVEINLENSVFNGKSDDDAAGTAILVNVPCTLNITNCEINGYMHAVIVRGGTVVIRDSVLTNTVEDDSLLHYFDDRNWGTGNTVNLAALTIGNKHPTSYQYPADCTLINTRVVSVGAYPAVYAYGNTGEGLGATLTYDAECEIVGGFVEGNDAVTVNAPN